MSPHTLRELGVLEKYHATRHFMGMDACVVASARYNTLDNRVLTKEILFPALRILLETHAPLSVRFDGRDDRSDVSFTRLASVNLARVVEFSGNSNLQSALEKQLSQRFEDTVGDMPLWRLQVLSDNTVLFAIHHAIGDGLSTAAFHRVLIRALNAVPSPPPTDSSTVAIHNIPHLPPIDDVTDLRPSLRTIFSVMFETFAPTSWTKGYTAWTGNPVPSVPKMQSHVRLMKFAPADAKRFAATCRSHETSVSGGLYALAVCVLSRLVLKANNHPQYKTISVSVPVALRGVTGTAPDVICNHVSNWVSNPPLSPHFSWAQAAGVAAELQVQKRKSGELLGLLGWGKSQLVAFMKSQLGTKRTHGLIISNLGRVEVPAEDGEGRWGMDDMVFNTCDTFAGPAMGMNVVSGPAGGLNISITWGEKSLETEFVDAFIEVFREEWNKVLE
ncbi:alcohol acetyltransferase-domain-containing protein [Mycena crocata]|nr:alcohol acetyltransferase-domain-containing protein [Mycena crocata]